MARVPQQIPNSKTQTFKGLNIVWEDSITMFLEKFQYTIVLQGFRLDFTVFDVAIKIFNAVSESLASSWAYLFRCVTWSLFLDVGQEVSKRAKPISV